MPLSDDERARLQIYLAEIECNVTAGRDLLDAIELNVNACREIILGPTSTESAEAAGDYGGGEGGSTGGGGGGGPVRTP